MITSDIIPGAGPFYFEGNNVGILLIHGGGGGTCADLKPLAEELHKTNKCSDADFMKADYGMNLYYSAVKEAQKAVRKQSLMSSTTIQLLFTCLLTFAYFSFQGPFQQLLGWFSWLIDLFM